MTLPSAARRLLVLGSLVLGPAAAACGAFASEDDSGYTPTSPSSDAGTTATGPGPIEGDAGSSGPDASPEAGACGAPFTPFHDDFLARAMVQGRWTEVLEVGTAETAPVLEVAGDASKHPDTLHVSASGGAGWTRALREAPSTTDCNVTLSFKVFVSLSAVQGFVASDFVRFAEVRFRDNDKGTAGGGVLALEVHASGPPSLLVSLQRSGETVAYSLAAFAFSLDAWHDIRVAIPATSSTTASTTTAQVSVDTTTQSNGSSGSPRLHGVTGVVVGVADVKNWVGDVWIDDVDIR